MSDKQTTVSVKILEKEYQVACPPEEVDALTASARYLDRQMADIRGSGKVFGMDRIAVMAGLNIANELLGNRGKAEQVSGVVEEKIRRLTDRISTTLAEHKQLKL
ncbi:MAG TPA: cell division protein ZapA [Pseudomonadales bacterium]